MSYGCVRRIQVRGIGVQVGNHPGFLLVLRSPRWHSMTILFNKQIQEPTVEKARILEGRGALLFVCSSASPGKSSYGNQEFLQTVFCAEIGDFDRSTAASGAFQSIIIYPGKSTLVKILGVCHGDYYTCFL
jgi:hypothetical protein